MQFLFYADQYGYAAEDYVLGVDDLDEEDGSEVSEQERDRYRQDIDQLKGSDRVWILFSHAWVDQENKVIVDHLNSLGEPLDFFEKPARLSICTT